MSDASIVVRMKEDQDGAEPASNSVAAMNLLRLASFLDNEGHRERAAKIFAVFNERLTKIPLAVPEMVSALMFKPTQIIVTGEDHPTKKLISPILHLIYSGPADPQRNPLLKTIQRGLIPSKVVVSATTAEPSSLIRQSLKVLADINADDCKAFVCKDFTCSAPIADPEELKKKLGLIT